MMTPVHDDDIGRRLDDFCKYPHDKVEIELRALKELMIEMFNSRDKAINTSFNSVNDKMVSMNTFRDQLKDQAAKFIIRDEHNVLLDQISRFQVNLQTVQGQFITREEQKLQQDSNDRQNQELSEINERVAGLEARFYLGGAGIVIVITALQLVFNIWKA
jgi:hypothetical protein